MARSPLPVGERGKERSLARRYSAGGDELFDLVLLQAVDLAQPEAQGRARIRATSFQRAVPIGEIDVGFARLDAMLARIAYDLRRRIKAHRLRVEQRRRECRRMVALDPRRHIDEVGKARRVALGK